MYEDRLDGRIEVEYYDRKAREWRSEQDRLSRSVEEHQNANTSYMDEGIRLPELAQRAPELFDRQSADEKRRLLDFVLSNCSWKGGRLTATFRQPFDILAVANESIW
jgi:site-specific DNA recombinase